MSPGFAAGHALLIGVGTYSHIPGWNVPITAVDAQEVEAVLRDQRLCGYPAAQVRRLSWPDATRERILAELDGLAQRLDEDQTFVLFYCGHGHYGSDGAYHLSTCDTQLAGDKKIVPGTAISHQELIERLRKIRARRVLLIFNACHSGEVSPGLGDEAADPGEPLPDATANALLATGEGRIIITACREDQKSYIGGGRLTLFTDALVKGLRGQGDVTSRNGYISAYDLYLHIHAEIQEIMERTGWQQEPELTVLKGHGPFAVALFRGATTLGAFDEQERPPSGSGVREVKPERSQKAFNAITNSQVGAIVNSQVAGRDIIGGNKVSGGRDAAGGDINKKG